LAMWYWPTDLIFNHAIENQSHLQPCIWPTHDLRPCSCLTDQSPVMFSTVQSQAMWSTPCFWPTKWSPAMIMTDLNPDKLQLTKIIHAPYFWTNDQPISGHACSCWLTNLRSCFRLNNLKPY
jgi:hypothetical protein